MNFLDRFEKKHRYLFQSLITGVYLYFASVVYFNHSLPLRFIVGTFVIFVGVFFTQYPNINLKNMFMSMVVPIHLILGALLILKYYPNLSLFFKFLIILGYSLMYYVTSLVENIFLVVQDREEVIPLYRVATVWGQILLVSIAIPLYAGIFKIPVNSFVQAGYVAVSAFIFSVYEIWCLRFENKLRPVGISVAVSLSSLVAFLVSSISMAISFIPSESFLRSLLVSSVLMFGLVYLSSYLKNEITKKLLLEYLIIIVLFLSILLVFQP